MALQKYLVEKSPSAFAGQADKHNQLVDLIANAQGRNGVVVRVTEGNILISFDPAAQDPGAEVNGLPAGYTFEEFTICDSGSSATRWWPTWLTDPS